MNRMLRAVPVLVALLLLPAAAYAQQGSIAGTVRDGSGGVLPGVTVEVTSPALIEKVRSTVSDSNGNYRITSLPVGVYTVTFTLEGFNPQSRNEIRLTTGFTANVDASLSLGGLQETISVVGEAPIVDVDNPRQAVTIEGDALRELPSGRTANALLNLVPSLEGSNGLCVGGTCGYTLNAFSAHGGNATEGRLQVDGMGVGAAIGGAGVSGYLADVANAQEVSFTLSGNMGESEVGGPVLNVVPRSGGNNLAGSYFTSFSNTRMWDHNNEDRNSVTQTNLRERDHDVNGTFSGPVVRDYLWFFFQARHQGSRTRVPNAFYNLNEGVFGANYVPDLSKPVKQKDEAKNGSLRLTWQASQRNKFNVFWDEQQWCVTCYGSGSAATSPEAATNVFNKPVHTGQVSWTNPLTSRILLEAGFSTLQFKWGLSPGEVNNSYMNIPRITETGPGAYNGNITSGASTIWDADSGNTNLRGSLSYITGTHNMKFGYQGAFITDAELGSVNDLRLSYGYNSTAAGQLPTPNSVTVQIPTFTDERTYFYGLYAQDQWTWNRFTFQGGIRFDHAWSFFPSSCVTGERFVKGNGFCFGEEEGRSDGVSFKDITPRWGVTWDVFGNGKTAVKYNMGKYLQPAQVGGLYNATNPVRRLQGFFIGGFPISMTRSWADTNGDRIVNCDLDNPLQHDSLGDICGNYQGNFAQFGAQPGTAGQTFATTQCGREEQPGTVSQAVLDYCNGVGLGAPNGAQNVLNGWGIRDYDWNFSLGVQHEVLPRVSAEVTYNRRWWGNFLLSDNVNLGCNQDPACLSANRQFVNPTYDFYQVTVPDDALLPEEVRGRIITGQANLDPQFQTLPTANAQVIDNIQTRYWHGVDTNVTVRARGGLRLTGGTSTGREVMDSCDIQEDEPNLRTCRTVEPFRTDFRGSVSYVIPKIDVLVSSILQYRPGAERSANMTIACGTFFAPAQCASNVFQWDPQSTTVVNGVTVPRTTLANNASTLNVNLLEPRSLYGEGIHEIDLKLAKVFRFGRTRTNVGLDIYNLLNHDGATGYVNTYPGQTIGGVFQPWGTVSGLMTPRFARVSVQLEF